MSTIIFVCKPLNGMRTSLVKRKVGKVIVKLLNGSGLVVQAVDKVAVKTWWGAGNIQLPTADPVSVVLSVALPYYCIKISE